MKRLLACLILPLALAGCSSATDAPATETKTEPKGPYMSDSNLYAIIETTMGDIRVQLYESESPKTVENFTGLATGEKEWKDPVSGEMQKSKPYFDGIIFHRVIPGFMVQTGDPTGTGMGGPGYNISDEYDSRLQYSREGILGMANSGPNTGGSQFFITHNPTPNLNCKHTIFGQVVEGQDIVVAIAAVETGAQDRPLKEISIKTIRIERVEDAAAGDATEGDGQK